MQYFFFESFEMQMLYAFGSNGSGQLGVGHNDDLSAPASTHGASDAVRGSIQQLVAGGNHTVVLYGDGTIKATGNNEDGRCGFMVIAQSANFVDVELPVDEHGRSLKVKQIAATWSTTTLLCHDGHLYVRGTGNSGELGLGEGTENVSGWKAIPAFPPSGSSIVEVTSSMAHTLAVLSNGEVYGWGKGRKGQLGEPAEDVWSPRKNHGIDFLATKAICGKDFTVTVGEPSTGLLKVLGAGGNDRFGVRANQPSDTTNWIDVAASWCSIYAVKSSGDVIAWGRNDHGQLPPHRLPEIADLAAGSEHCLALTKAGKVLAWGWGEHGNCGAPTDDRGDIKGRWNEFEVRGRVVKVFAGCATSFILTEDDEPGD